MRQSLQEVMRALAVLALVFFTLSAAMPGIATTSVVLREAGVVATQVSDFCGHDQPNVACHAPAACCRPDHAILPPQRLSTDHAFIAVETIAFDVVRPAPSRTSPALGFRSRAPPASAA